MTRSWSRARSASARATPTGVFSRSSTSCVAATSTRSVLTCQSDRAPLSLHRNADPGSTLSLGYVDRLQCFVDYKVKRFTASTRLDDDLLGSTSRSPAARTREQKRLGEQSRFVKTLAKLVAAAPRHKATSDAAEDASAGDDIRVDLVATPDLLRAPPASQGPFLLQPAPRVLSGSVDAFASDVVALEVTPTGSSGPALRLLLIVSSDGRVDVCLLVEAVDARWTVSRVRLLCPRIP